jgi:pimeloyl-ACP methyl ester carboxylesterase
MPRFTSDDADIAYEITGDGPPVVLLHPFPVNRRFWHPAAELLATRYRLIMPDLRAHGESGVGAGPATMEKHALDISRLCDRVGVGRAVFAGVSIGGYILFEFWRRSRERISALIFSDTKAAADTEEARAARLKSAEEVEQSGPVAFADAMIPKLLGETTRTNRPDLVDRARQMMLQTKVAGIAAALRGLAARPDSTSTLKTIAVPTLVLNGSEDTLTGEADAAIIHHGIAGSRLEIVPQAGHYAAFEQHQAAARLLRGFLDGLKDW